MARRLFANGLEADPGNPFVCHAWGLMEQRDGDMDKARDILKVFNVLGCLAAWDVVLGRALPCGSMGCRAICLVLCSA